MNEGLRANEENIEYLQLELQQQRGMLWLLGEIIKAAINITEFKHGSYGGNYLLSMDKNREH